MIFAITSFSSLNFLPRPIPWNLITGEADSNQISNHTFPWNSNFYFFYWLHSLRCSSWNDPITIDAFFHFRFAHEMVSWFLFGCGSSRALHSVYYWLDSVVKSWNHVIYWPQKCGFLPLNISKHFWMPKYS